MADPRISHSTHYPVNFALSFSHTNLDLNTNNMTIPTKHRRISATLTSIEYPNFQMGLIVGSSFSSLDNDTATEGMNLNGNHVGLTAIGNLTSIPQIGFHARYLFQETRGENALRSASLALHEWLTEISMGFFTKSRWAFNIGLGASGIDADRHVHGDINETLRLKHKTGFQGRLNINLNTSPSGQVSLRFNRGVFNGSQLEFSRTY